jgi:2-polyprenyl-6-methoxyphenol hydroxylase-like FAD-dependent oxidoreductase
MSVLSGHDEQGLRATIVGGGIGGLSAALALRRARISVTIFERQDQLREIGSGLTLWTNAVKALRQLDLEEALQAISAPLERFEFWSSRGKLLGTLPLRQYSERLGAPSVEVHRADRLALLARALEDCPIVLSAQCIGFAHHSEGVTARFADGRTATTVRRLHVLAGSHHVRARSRLPRDHQ